MLLVAAVVLLAASTLSLRGLHGFDYAVVRGLNRFSGRSVLVDHLVHDLTGEVVLQRADDGAGLACLVRACWPPSPRRRSATGCRCCLPDHARPLNDPGIVFRVPPAINPAVFSGGMAFPSEHAALMFGLAGTVWLADRRLGGLGFALACCLVAARVYLGFVFPTDIVTGAMLGVLASGPAQAPGLLRGAGRIVRRGEGQPGAFAALSFYVCFGIGQLFEDYRYVAASVMRVLRSHLVH